MLGFVVGTACLLGLIHVVRGGHRCGPHGRWHGHPGHGGWAGRGGFGPRFMLRPLFERLDTSPGQEKAIVAAIDDMLSSVSGVRRELMAARGEIAAAVRQPALGDDALASPEAKLHGALGTVHGAAATALHKIHEVLDDKQRARLADLIEAGPVWMDPWRGHPYRCAC